MSDNQREEFLARWANEAAECARKFHADLAKVGLTRAEYAIFLTLHYGMTGKPEQMADSAAAEYYSGDCDQVTVEECRSAMFDCFSKGWVRVMDQAAIDEAAADLKRREIFGPIYDFPPVGGVDFTRTGADLWLRYSELSHPNRPKSGLTCTVHTKTALYVCSERAIRLISDEVKEWDAVVALSEPVATGPWRAQWWQRFAGGYRIDVEQKRQIHGGMQDFGESCEWMREKPGPPLEKLHLILDRHMLTLPQWALLAALENRCFRLQNGDVPWHILEHAQFNFGKALSESDLRAAMQANLREGWLRPTTQQTDDEIHKLIADDPVSMPVPKTTRQISDDVFYDCQLMDWSTRVPVLAPRSHHWGEIDFAPEGARLYHSISTEWRDPNWEDEFRASNVYYCEHHHYGETEKGFDQIIVEHRAKGHDVQSSVVPLDRWCVHWWEVFPKGYRLELKIGDPSAGILQ